MIHSLVRSFLFSPLAVLFATVCLAQGNETPRSPLDATSWGVVYDVPATRDVKVRADVPYLRDARGTLAMDIYLPPDVKAGEKRPAVVFLNAIGDQPGNKLKSWEIYKTWPRLVAAHGMVGVSMEADGARILECLRAVFAFLVEHGGEHNIDGGRLGVYAASANVRWASEFLLSESAPTGIRAAALYYGQPPAGKLRTDLPVLFIVAASDAPGLGAPLTDLWRRVVEAGAPWSLAFASRLPHGFDGFSDNDDARRMIQQSIAFWKSHLEPVPQPSWAPAPARAIVASSYGNDPQRTVELVAQWIADHPNDAEAHLFYGRALAQLRRADEAAVALERAMALGLNQPSVFNWLGQVRVSQQKWGEAERLLNRAIEGGMRNSLTFGQLAYAQLRLGRNEESVRNYEQAFAVGIPQGANTRGVASFNLACGYARLGQKEKAFEALERAANDGFGARAEYEKEESLAPLRNDPRFQRIVDRLSKPSPQVK
jgi:tetratricopeptide (TPR) repeat protein